MTKEEARSSVMGAISMALKDPTLQQGFEIICKNLSELEETNAKLQAKIDDWQSEYIELENFKNNEIAELEQENKTLSRKANEAIADKLLITAKYNEVLNDLNQENDKLQKENAELKEQIEKMKCCQNCKFEDNDCIEEPCSACTRCLGDIKRKGNSDKWEIK